MVVLCHSTKTTYSLGIMYTSTPSHSLKHTPMCMHTNSHMHACMFVYTNTHTVNHCLSAWLVIDQLIWRCMSGVCLVAVWMWGWVYQAFLTVGTLAGVICLCLFVLLMLWEVGWLGSWWFQDHQKSKRLGFGVP